MWITNVDFSKSKLKRTKNSLIEEPELEKPSDVAQLESLGIPQIQLDTADEYEIRQYEEALDRIRLRSVDYSTLRLMNWSLVMFHNR